MAQTRCMVINITVIVVLFFGFIIIFKMTRQTFVQHKGLLSSDFKQKTPNVSVDRSSFGKTVEDTNHWITRQTHQELATRVMKPINVTRFNNEEPVKNHTFINSKCGPDFDLFPPQVFMYSKFPQKSPFLDTGTIYTQKIVILTPISNAHLTLENYFKLLCSLSYPHHLLSVVLGEDSSTDNSIDTAKAYASKLKHHFRRIEVLHFNDTLDGIVGSKRHEYEYQKVRRKHLAQSRNQLLLGGLEDEDYVLWIDNDLAYFPPNIIQHLLSANGDVVTTSCMLLTHDRKSLIYDRNSWQETNESLEYLEKKPGDFLMLEGYEDMKLTSKKSLRKLLPDINNQGLIVALDGVGACTLLVKAKCHRMGLVFPPFIFDHQIETEGLGRMAQKMNLTVMGLPFVQVFHQDRL